MCATITNRLLRDERGVGVVAALLVILILALLGTVVVALTVEEMDAARLHVESEQALSVAAAGLDWSENMYQANSSWTGLATPRAVGPGSFTVAIASTDADGNTLPSGTKALKITGTVRGASRTICRLASLINGVYTIGAQGAGNAYSISSSRVFSNATRAYDATSPNGTWATGDWSGPDQILVTNFGGATIPSSPITKVEVLVYGYVSKSLTNDYVNLRVYYGTTRQGSIRSISRTVLNTRVGAANAGYWTVDFTTNRAWTAADFTGDVDINLRCVRSRGDDGGFINIDSIGFRVTTAGGTVVTLGAYQEVVS